MKKALLLGLAALLIAPAAFCASALLRLERAPSPSGVWEEVPANELPITAEGAFEDTFDSKTAYYQMRIDAVEEGLLPPHIPFDDLPSKQQNAVKGFLDDLRNLGEDNSWAEAEVFPLAFPIYDPVLEAAAYMEFKIFVPPPLVVMSGAGPLSQSSSLLLPPPIHREQDAGFILVSMTEDDAPVIEHSMEGMTRTEYLRLLAKSSGVRIFRYGDSLLAAEDEKGQLVAYIGAPPMYYPDDILQYCDQEFDGYADPQGGKHPDPLPFKPEPYKTYQDFKQDWVRSKRFQLARERRKQEASLLWQIYTGQLQQKIIYVPMGGAIVAYPETQVKEFTLGNPALAYVTIQKLGVHLAGRQEGTTTYHVLFVDGRSEDGYVVVGQKALSPEQPTIGWTSWHEYYAGTWSQQRRYTQEPGGSCYSGCGPTAWAMLYGWFDYTGAATNLIAGSAPLYNNDAVRDCIWYVVEQVDTYCVGDQGATNPWDMYKGYKWAEHVGHGYSVSYSWTIPCFSSSSARNKARDSIKNDGRPTIIGIGCTSAHYPVAYGYKYREWKGLFGEVWSTERKFKCNMGWGGGSPEWKNGDVWYGQRNNFW